MNNFIVGIIIGILLVVIITFILDPDKIWQDNIIKAGHGEYNSTTGKFQFLPACNKETK
jgi:hypothetical protein